MRRSAGFSRRASTGGRACGRLATRALERYLAFLPRLAQAAHKKPRCALKFDCLIQCGLRDGIATAGQFCIDTRLAFALKGDVKKGLFFRGSEALPFGNAIRPVADLMRYLLTGATAGTA